MNSIKQYFAVALFIMLYKEVLTFESVNEILKCDCSNESLLVVLFHSTVCFQCFTKLLFFLILIWSLS